MSDTWEFEYGRLATAVELYLTGETSVDRLRVVLEESRARVTPPTAAVHEFARAARRRPIVRSRRERCV